MSGLRDLREAAGLTQAQLAARAGVSRQLVGAVEVGKHLPRVDAALALAAALGVDVAALFLPEAAPAVDVVTGSAPADGELVRMGVVGDRTVTAPVRTGPGGWDVADGVVEAGAISTLGRRRAPGLVVVGCEPGLEALERILREGGTGAVAATGSSAAAVDALAGGRVHAAVVHGPAPADDRKLAGERFTIARWRVGIAGPSDAAPGWWREALTGRVSVVQREEGAGVQRAFLDAAHAAPPGPRVGTHLEAARFAVLAGMPAVTIEPAALAVGASFHALDVHEVQLWVARIHESEPVVADALEVLGSPRFQRRLAAVGGYDLAGLPARVA
jgi:DNA-binding XRE family transcriptional regulator